MRASKPALKLTLLGAALLASPALAQTGAATREPPADFGAVFDEHWEKLRDEYPYFEMYAVDWEAEREAHRPLAVAAKSATEFTWEMARMISVLPDAHVSFLPAPSLMKDWSYPEIRTGRAEGRLYVLDWGASLGSVSHPLAVDDPRAYPEILAIQGAPLGSVAEILAAGPLGSPFELQLLWPDGSRSAERILRPTVSNLPPDPKHFGEDWIVSGQVGSIGYLRVKTFSPKLCTLGPAGKMTPILREHLKALRNTEGLILDVQGNGGGQVAASDPFLSHFLTRRVSYRWGNAKGRKRTLVPRSPRYRSPVVVLVDERTASGGEWAARILRDAGRAQVVGGPTRGAEAAVHTFVASDGSTLNYSAWPMVEPGVTPFQATGVQLDVALPLRVEALRSFGHEAALLRIQEARMAQALELLGAQDADLAELLALAREAAPAK